MKKEFNLLNYFNMRALFMGIGLSHILISAHEYYFISIILGTILGVLFLRFIKIEMTNKYINILSYSILIIILLLIIINMISTMYLTDMPKPMIMIPFIFIILYILNKKEIIIFRLTNIVLIINIILYVMAVCSLIPYLDLTSFSYTNTNVKNILTSALDYFLLSLLPTLSTRKKEYKDINIIKTYLISSFTMLILFTLTYGILGPNLSEIFRYPEYIILKKISIANTLNNIQNIISFIWIFDVLMSSLSIGNLIKEKINNKLIFNIWIIILSFITLIINRYYLLIMLPHKYVTITFLSVFLLLFIFNKKEIVK